MASIVESGWLYLITHFSDFQLASLGSFFLHESVFFLSGLPFIFLERAGRLRKYKIQTKNNTPAAQEKCIMRLLLYHFCVNLPLMILSYPVFRYMGLSSSLPLPSWKVILSQILFYFILEDFVFYWGHRILHTKWLYKHVHSVHHEYATPFGLTSEYAHPAEILFLGFATIIGPAITGPHLLTLWLWMVLRVLETVEAHCGYHFPWSFSNFFPLYGGAMFIRAPAILEAGPNVEVLADYSVPRDKATSSKSSAESGEEQTASEEKVIVAVKQANLLGTAFHPELTADTRWHSFFLKMVGEAGDQSSSSISMAEEDLVDCQQPRPFDLPIFQ